MAINVSFNGATIFKPGAYSKEEIDLGGGFPLSPTGIVAIFGESSSGTPGALVPNLANNVFSPDQMTQIIAEYGQGPLVDACQFLFSPGADGAIPGGAQAVYIYKTNASTQAILDPIPQGAGAFGALQSQVYGVSANQITFKNALVPETPASISGSAITLPLVISGSSNTLTFSLNGGAPVTATIPAASYSTIASLVTAINGVLPANSLVASAGAGTSIELTQATGTNLNRNGWGRSFQIGAGNANSVLGLTANQLATAADEPQANLTIANVVSTLNENGLVGGQIVMSIGRDDLDAATAASVSITSSSVVLSQSGVTPASYTLAISNFPTISSLVQYINQLPHWNASVASVQLGLQPISILDQVSNVGALYSGSVAVQPARIKNDASSVVNFFSLSQQVNLIASIADASPVATVGLPDQMGVPNAAYLTGGLLGATPSAEISNALAKFQKFRVNSVVPLFSRDAAADIADEVTDPGSTYTIAAIQQAVKTHLSLMATTKKKSERQGYLSQKDTYANCKIAAATMAYSRIQLVIQDIKQVSAQGVLQWYQPWAGACLLAGARGGSPVGLPMTFKYFNVSGIRQTAQPMSTPDANIIEDFDPDTQYDDAIQNGVTFWEAPQTGGFRLVVDNTTYNTDGNWVLNRGNVQYAADVVAYDFRSQLENIYIGVKNTVTAAEIKSTCEAILGTYLAQGITVSTSDAKNGFKQLVVQLNGNTVNISVIVKLVEGIDFILADITLQRASSQA